MTIRRLYRRWRRLATRRARFNLAVLLTVVVLAYAGVPAVARFVESLAGYNPTYYEPKDTERETWLQRASGADGVLAHIPWETVSNVALFLLVAGVWLTLLPSRSPRRRPPR